MGQIQLLIFGLLIVVIGILNIKGNIKTVHSYNRRKVKEEDIPKYGKVVGIGTMIIGISLIVSYIITFWNEAIVEGIMITGFVIGFAFILYGQIKYNKGIF